MGVGLAEYNIIEKTEIPREFFGHLRPFYTQIFELEKEKRKKRGGSE